jgi:hypothetical protein
MKRNGHKDLYCDQTGLTLMLEHSYLGASADGRIYNHMHHKDSFGILEIKCPYSIEGNSVQDIAKRFLKTFFLEFNEAGKLQLKKSSNYYFQVQGEMAIMRSQWCHFVVWTKDYDNMFVEEILFDCQMQSEIMFPKLQNFYISTLVPEILSHCVQKEIQGGQ